MALRDALLLVTIVLFLIGVGRFASFGARLWRVLRAARPITRSDRLGERLMSVAQHVFDRRMMKEPLAGLLHLFIFSGFLVLFLDIIETIGEPFGFSIGPILAPFVDVFVLFVLIGLALAVYQRRVLRPHRFEGSDEGDALHILYLIGAIMVGILIHDSFFPFAGPLVFHVPDVTARSHFLGWAISRLWQDLGWNRPVPAAIGYTVGYLLDIGVVLYFLSYLPGSKHLHIALAIPNIVFRRLPERSTVLVEARPDGAAIRSFEDFTWKDILDLFTCTECGRCQDVCPAWQNRQVLSPKMVILELRDALRAQMEGPAPADGWPALAGGVVRAEELWDCTTCGACMEACPVFIEHVPKIVGLRAALTEEGRLAGNAQDALEAWQSHANSFDRPASERGHWTDALGFPVPDARREAVDYLWFVGDFASFDPAVQEITRLVAHTLKTAGVNFGILYDGERNSGNDVLAMGEFGLYRRLAEGNIEALKSANYQRVLTTDPHSLHALRQEYARLGVTVPVRHHTEVFLELVEEGRLPVSPLGLRATYHDPCYLARWSGITEAPRRLLERIGVELVEMPHNRENTFCCGAGGGKIFIDGGGSGERPAEKRMKEAMPLGVDHFVVSCPKDVVMFTAQAQQMGLADGMKVVEVTELLAKAAGVSVVPAPLVS